MYHLNDFLCIIAPINLPDRLIANAPRAASARFQTASSNITTALIENIILH